VLENFTSPKKIITKPLSTPLIIGSRVLKPRQARRVDSGPDRPGSKTGPGGDKNSLGSWPSET